jgi:DNA transformation protein
MAATPEEIEHARDLFAELSPVTTGRMFGGTALYLDGDVMFACLLGGTIWMKSDTSTEAAFAAAGSHPFSYQKSGGTTVVPSLMSLPDSALDDPEEAVHWARLSYPPPSKPPKTNAVKRPAKPRKRPHHERVRRRHRLCSRVV